MQAIYEENQHRPATAADRENRKQASREQKGSTAAQRLGGKTGRHEEVGRQACSHHSKGHEVATEEVSTVAGRTLGGPQQM